MGKLTKLMLFRTLAQSACEIIGLDRRRDEYSSAPVIRSR
jgi:hypothetical protein